MLRSQKFRQRSSAPSDVGPRPGYSLTQRALRGTLDNFSSTAVSVFRGFPHKTEQNVTKQAGNPNKDNKILGSHQGEPLWLG